MPKQVRHDIFLDLPITTQSVEGGAGEKYDKIELQKTHQFNERVGFLIRQSIGDAISDLSD
jgi:hypothetical protein